MDSQSPVIFIFLILILLSVFSGCTYIPGTQATPGQGSHPGGHHNTNASEIQTTSVSFSNVSITPKQTVVIPEQTVVSGNSENPIYHEANRMFQNIKYTKYVHPPDYVVNDAEGIYEFDCDGFVSRVLMNVNPAIYQELRQKSIPIPLTKYISYFNSLDTQTPNNIGWTRVAHPIDLKPGDICIFAPLSTPHSGHVFVIDEEPTMNAVQNNEVLVRVIDSVPAGSQETADTRTGSSTGGLGSGILSLMVDTAGDPYGYNWNQYTAPVNVTIVCGRLNK